LSVTTLPWTSYRVADLRRVRRRHRQIVPAAGGTRAVAHVVPVTAHDRRVRLDDLRAQGDVLAGKHGLFVVDLRDRLAALGGSDARYLDAGASESKRAWGFSPPAAAAPPVPAMSGAPAAPWTCTEFTK
jgi:hypothetical protein